MYNNQVVKKEKFNKKNCGYIKFVEIYKRGEKCKIILKN